MSGVSGDACDEYDSVAGGSDNIIGGSDGDLSYNASIAGGLTNGIVGSAGAFIGGGWRNLISNEAPSPYYNSNLSAIVAGNANVIASPNSFIGAGYGNSISSPTYSVPNAPDSFIGAGYANSIASDYAAISGGYANSVTGEYADIDGGLTNTASAGYAAIAGGENNSAGSANSFIGSGANNTISLNGGIGAPNGPQYATIAGGLYNNIESLISNGAKYGFIGGGHGNSLSAFNGVIAGGQYNTASGDYSTIPGGQSNVAAGVDSFAAGNSSQALNNGAFVWSDDSIGAKTLKSTAINQFVARAAGGFYLYSSASLATGVKLAPGSGSWSNVSDRAAKTAIEDVDDARVLARVAALPVSEWSYSAQGVGVRHLGPMAQDFRAAFGLGEDDKHISTVDEEGVALAAIKALQAEVAQKDRQLVEMRRADDAKFARIEQRLEAIETASAPAPSSP